MFLEGFLWIDDTEVFNNGRTLANVVTARAAGSLPQNFLLTGATDCDCAAYFLNPTIPLNVSVLGACLPSCITDAALNSIPTLNPWYDAGITESAEFLGAWVHKVTGLDGRHNARNTTPRVAFPRGSVLSPLQPTHRTVSYELTLIAKSDCGLSYGMEWLERQLASSCDACGLGTAYVRSCCPPANDPDNGLWLLEEFGLAEGPEWEDPLDSRMAAYMRDATVAFYAGNPCRFSKPEPCLDWTPLWTGVFGDTVGAVGTACCSIPDASKTYDWAPIISIEADISGDSLPFTVKAYEDVQNYGAGVCATAGEVVGAGTVVFSIGVASLPAGHTLVLDGSTRRIWFSGPTTGYVAIDGSAYIDATAGFVQWGLICGADAAVKARVDSAVLSAAFINNALNGGPFYAAPRVLVDLVKRGGC